MVSDILKAQSDYVVIPVNKVGVAGAGLAYQWAQKYPEEVEEYKAWCIKVRAGEAPEQIITGGRHILLPTKTHWRDNSNMEDIHHRVVYMYSYMIPHFKNKSVSVPLLGAGLGNLNRDDVKKMLKKLALGARFLYDIDTDVIA